MSSSVFSELDLSADYLHEVLQTSTFQILVPAGKKQKLVVVFVSNLLDWDPTLFLRALASSSSLDCCCVLHLRSSASIRRDVCN